MKQHLLPRHDRRNRFIRFVAVGGHVIKGFHYDRRYWRERDPLDHMGILSVANHEIKNKLFDRIDRHDVRRLFIWFNTHIPCPPWSKFKSTSRYNEDWICWFRLTARRAIYRMRKLADILRANHIVVRELYTDNLLRVRYEDRYQVVADSHGGIQ